MQEKFYVNKTEYFTAEAKNNHKKHFEVEFNTIIYKVSVSTSKAYIQVYKLRKGNHIFCCNDCANSCNEYKMELSAFYDYFSSSECYTGNISTTLYFDKNKCCIYDGYFLDFKKALRFFNREVKKQKVI